MMGEHALRGAAVIDVGTNSVKFYAVTLNEDGTPVERRDASCVTRLGEDTRKTGILKPDAVARTAEAVAAFAADAQAMGIGVIECVGTMALRQAMNAADFIRAVREKCSLNVRVLSGVEEARLCFQASASDLQGRALVIDSGGGSTEFACGMDGVPVRRVSVPVGAVNVTERFFAAKTDAEAVDAACDSIRREFAAAGLSTEEGACVATGGTATTMVAVMLGLDRYDSTRISGQYLSLKETERQIQLYASLDLEQRRALPGMHKGREDVILAGACILKEAMLALGTHGLTVQDRGLRHALVKELLS